MVLDAFSLAGRVGIVTGGGQGLGKVYCRAFAEAGADVVVAEMNPATGPETVEEVRALGRRALFTRTDVRDPSSVDDMLAQAVAEFGRVDFLVNNAGIVKWGEAETAALDDWHNVMNVNLNGAVLLLPGGRPAHDRAAHRQHRQHRLDVGPDRQPAAAAGVVQHVQSGRDSPHPVAGGRVGAIRRARQRHRARLHGHGHGPALLR